MFLIGIESSYLSHQANLQLVSILHLSHNLCSQRLEQGGSMKIRLRHGEGWRLLLLRFLPRFREKLLIYASIQTGKGKLCSRLVKPRHLTSLLLNLCQHIIYLLQVEPQLIIHLAGCRHLLEHPIARNPVHGKGSLVIRPVKVALQNKKHLARLLLASQQHLTLRERRIFYI